MLESDDETAMHPIFRVTSVELLGGYRLRIGFDDGSVQEVDLEPVLAGEVYSTLRDHTLFASVEIDPEVHTLVWPTGADFDPAILHDWPRHETAMRQLAQRWAVARVEPQGEPSETGALTRRRKIPA